MFIFGTYNQPGTDAWASLTNRRCVVDDHAGRLGCKGRKLFGEHSGFCDLEMLLKRCLVSPFLDKDQTHRILGVLMNAVGYATRLSPGARNMLETELERLRDASFPYQNSTDYQDHLLPPMLSGELCA